jgi:hypothetical protein
MAQKRVRLSPEEVKAQLEAERREAPGGPAPAFFNPFAEALAGLKGKSPRKPPARKPAPEPTPLAEARARHKAARDALANSVKPLRRSAATQQTPGSAVGARDRADAGDTDDDDPA